MGCPCRAERRLASADLLASQITRSHNPPPTKVDCCLPLPPGRRNRSTTPPADPVAGADMNRTARPSSRDRRVTQGIRYHVPTPGERLRTARYLAPAAFAILLAAIVIVVVTSAGSSGTHASHPRATRHSIPPYWTVRPGDTFAQISEKTGLTIDQLEAFNPHTDPYGLASGQRLNLWQHPPPPTPPPAKPLGAWVTMPAERRFGPFQGINSSAAIARMAAERLSGRR